MAAVRWIYRNPAFQKPGHAWLLRSNPARNPALLLWVTEAFSETTVTRWLSRNLAFQKPGQ